MSKKSITDYLTGNIISPFNCLNTTDGSAQFESGKKAAQEFEEVNIATNGEWSASKKVDGSPSHLSYERIGYQAHSEKTFQGFFEGTAKIYLHRIEGRLNDLVTYRLEKVDGEIVAYRKSPCCPEERVV